jgi:hypothetical protein
MAGLPVPTFTNAVLSTSSKATSYSTPGSVATQGRPRNARPV